MTSTTTTSTAEERPQAGHPSKPRFDKRYIAPLFITCILVAANFNFRVLESLDRTLLAIGAAVLCEIVLSRVFTGKWPNLASSYITGISVGILVRSPAFWPYALCSVIAITSKYAIRWRGRHLWNPSNLGISVLLLLAPWAVATLSVQWDNRMWAMLVIWILGSAIIWNLKRFHICATYVISFLLFAGVRTLITGDPWLAEVSPITGPMYQLFIFFMITDPKTTVRSKTGQCVVVFVVALVEMIMRLFQVIHAPYYALFMVGPAAVALEVWLTTRNRPVGETQEMREAEALNMSPAQKTGTATQ